MGGCPDRCGWLRWKMEGYTENHREDSENLRELCGSLCLLCGSLGNKKNATIDRSVLTGSDALFSFIEFAIQINLH
jgi:hypothetical protein